MPEAFIVEIKNKPAKIEVLSPTNSRKYIENERWGFRITGGAEFGMPITVFQVTEGGRADQAGIQLGDTIVKINEVDIRNMSLAETHKKIESAGNDIKLSVKNFEEDENNEKSVNGHDVILDNKSDSRKQLLEKKPEIDRVNLEDKLRAMQKRLAQIATIPYLIQSTLDAVSKTFDGFIPSTVDDDDDASDIVVMSSKNKDDDLELENVMVIKDLNDNNNLNNNLKLYDIDENEELCNNDDDHDDDVNTDGDNFDKSIEFNSSFEIEEELTREPSPMVPLELSENAILRMEKQLKLKEMEKSWPWSDREKKIYKRSNCHLVPTANLIQNKIKQLNESKIFANYTRKYHGIN